MKYVYSIAVWVLDEIEDSTTMLVAFAWIGGTIAGIGLFQGWKVYNGGFWGYVAGIACGVAMWGLCWLCGQGVKAIHRHHRPESPLLKKKHINACPACGYDRTGLPQTPPGPAPCPECGKSA